MNNEDFVEIFKRNGKVEFKSTKFEVGVNFFYPLEKTTLKTYALNISLYSIAFDLKNKKPY